MRIDERKAKVIMEAHSDGEGGRRKPRLERIDCVEKLADRRGRPCQRSIVSPMIEEG